MREIFIERTEDIIRIAVLENKRLVECYMEEENIEPLPGQIYKGIVKNIIPAIKSAFVDIGFGKNCYMYIDRKFNNTHVKKNDELIVEILKEAVGEKGPKVTNAVTIPGRYVVIETLNKKINFSKKIYNENFKDSVRKNAKKPEDIGLMIRTNAENVSLETINNEIDKLYAIYKSILKEATYSNKPKLLFAGEGTLDKVLRDNISDKVAKIVVNNNKDYEYITNFFKLSSDINFQIELYTDSMSLFSFYGVERLLLDLMNRKIELSSGGYIVIDKTEAMYVIDVNSGKNTKDVSMDKVILNTNLEAAREIARQIKLRNLSGIIIIDFINMDNAVSKDKVLEEIKIAMQDDKSKPVIYPFTQLNLVQISRKRIGKPINEYIEQKCDCCEGRGNRLKLNYLATLIRNEVIKIEKDHEVDNIYIEIGSHHKDFILNDITAFAQRISCQNKKIYVSFVKHMDSYKLEPLIFQNHIENMQKFKIYG